MDNRRIVYTGILAAYGRNMRLWNPFQIKTRLILNLNYRCATSDYTQVIQHDRQWVDNNNNVINNTFFTLSV